MLYRISSIWQTFQCVRQVMTIYESGQVPPVECPYFISNKNTAYIFQNRRHESNDIDTTSRLCSTRFPQDDLHRPVMAKLFTSAGHFGKQLFLSGPSGIKARIISIRYIVSILFIRHKCTYINFLYHHSVGTYRMTCFLIFNDY